MMRARNVMVGVAGIGMAGEAMTRALARSLAGPRGPEGDPLHPRQMRDAPRAEGKAPKVKDWHFRTRKGSRPS
jgi:hypothetical protein